MSDIYQDKGLNEVQAQNKISEGDILFGQGKYGEAEKLYQEAVNLLQICDEQTKQKLLPKAKEKLANAKARNKEA